MPPITRRTLMTAAATLPLAGAALASAPMAGSTQALHRRVTLGGFEVTTLLAGTAMRDDPHSIFGLDVDEATFEATAREAFLPADRAQFYFTPTIVNTGAELILFDTGLDAGGITAALAAAGYRPDQVDVVVITHMHGDHIGGLMSDGAPTFANARYVTGAREFDAWSGMDSDGFDTKVRPLAERMTMLDPGGAPAAGITAVEAFGHTPGHMAYMLESDGQSLLIAADFANHYAFSLARPEWEVKFDMDKPMAAATRRRLLGMLADERIPFIGYHMPFPAIGYVEPVGIGFRYLPETYQLAR